MALRLSWKGCLFGCLGFAVLMVILAVSLGVWLTKKGTFETDTTIVSSRAEYFARMDLRAEDELLVNFFVEQAQSLNENSPGYNRLPAFYKDWQQGKSKKDILKMLPLKFEVVGLVSEDLFNGAVGFSFYNNMARVVFYFVKREARKEGRLMEHNGVPFVRFPGRDSFYLSLQNNTFYVSNLETGMASMLDNKNRSRDENELDPRFRGLDMNAPIYGFIRGKATNLDWHELVYRKNVYYLETEPEADTTRSGENPMSFLEEADRIGFDMRVGGVDSLVGNIVLDLDEPSSQKQAVLENALEELVGDSRLEFKYNVHVTDTGFVIDYEVSGFMEAASILH